MSTYPVKQLKKQGFQAHIRDKSGCVKGTNLDILCRTLILKIKDKINPNSVSSFLRKCDLVKLESGHYFSITISAWFFCGVSGFLSQTKDIHLGDGTLNQLLMRVSGPSLLNVSPTITL